MFEPSNDIVIRPVQKEQWQDLESLFGPSGAYSGCWCMWWRLKSKEFESNGNSGNKAAMQKIVSANEIPGLLAFKADLPIGWISLGPREVFGRLQRSPLLKAVDQQPLWSIVCFFIQKEFRNQGVASTLIQAAIDFAKSNGAQAIEAYPIDTRGLDKSQADLFTGTQEMFEEAGFKEIARRKASRPIFRKLL